MSLQQSDLLARLDAFSLDEPGVSLPFTHRLARENGWSANFADRVVREYKRFLFLAMEAGHPVTPSEAVDQAWHLHLLYTRHYWEVTCRDLLGRPLHHGPTRGGATEAAKFDDWYARTKESYRRLIGEEPPEDIWPPGNERFRPRRWQRVDRSRYWLVPRWRWPSVASFGRAIGVAGAASGLAGCAAVSVEGGPSLPGTMVPLWVGAWLAGRWLGKDRSPNREEPAPLDPFTIAVLAGGATRAAAAALGSLHIRGVTTVIKADKGSFLLARELSDADPPVERLALRLNHPPCLLTVKSVTHSLAGAAQAARHVLTAAGLLRTTADLGKARLWSIVPFLPVLGVCALIPDGRAAERVVAVAATLVVAGLTAATVPARSRRGTDLLRRLRRNHAALADPSRRQLLANPDTPGLAIALFGPGCLASAGFSSTAALLNPKPDRKNGSTDSGGGCGGASSGSSWFSWPDFGGDSDSGCGSSGCGGGCGGD